MLGLIIVCSTLCAMALFFYIFAHTDTGKRFFSETEN